MTVAQQPMTRKDALAAFAAAATGAAIVSAAPLAAFADETATLEMSVDSVPTDWGLTRQYYPVSIFSRLCLPPYI